MRILKLKTRITKPDHANFKASKPAKADANETIVDPKRNQGKGLSEVQKPALDKTRG